MTTPIVAESSDSEQNPQGPREAFLELFPQNRRGTISNLFLSAVRAGGATTPEAVVRHVQANLWRRRASARQWRNQAEEERLRPYAVAINVHPKEALGFAGWALAWCALPEEERQRVKRQRQSHYREAWMGERPPSGAQLKFLSALGWQGDPGVESMLTASALIERLKAEKAGAK
jgi:hypothetical protein